jgi:hypothetical protein
MGTASTIFLLAVTSSLFAEEPPFEFRVTERYEGKGDSLSAAVKLRNRHDHPVWFVYAGHGNVLLPYNGKCKPSSSFSEVPFEAEAYEEGKGKAVIVSVYGENSFHAVLLPPKATFSFVGFFIHSRGPARFLDLWEVKSIRVNDKTPLEEWMPFDIASSESVTIAGRMGSGKQKVLGWHHRQQPNPKPYPDEKITTVNLEPIARYIVPLPD